MSTPRAKRSALDWLEQVQNANAAWNAENDDSTLINIPEEVVQAVRQSGYVRYMNMLTGSGETYFSHVMFVSLILDMGIVVPRTIIVTVPKKLGSRRKNVNQKIRERWEQDGRPPITSRYCLRLAREFLPLEFEKAKTRPKQKDLIDKVRIVLLRQSKRAPTIPEQKGVVGGFRNVGAALDRLLARLKSEAATDFTK
jgi:hypothetical protein